MKKFLLCVLCLCFAQNVQASHLTNPFFLPKKDSLLSITNFNYQKYHLKQSAMPLQRHRVRARTLQQDIEYGLSDRAALWLSLSNAWTRHTPDIGSTRKESTNLNWAIGGHYDLYHTDNYSFQAKVRFLQKETHHFRGAYKALDANVRTGYDLDSVLPYLGVWGQLPIAQSSLADDKVKCGSYAGFYTDLNASSLDLRLHYDYDRFDKLHRVYLHSAIDLMLSENVAVGGYFDYVLLEKGYPSTKADGHTIGGRVYIQF